MPINDVTLLLKSVTHYEINEPTFVMCKGLMLPEKLRIDMNFTANINRILFINTELNKY
jgi:hypothetical protein